MSLEKGVTDSLEEKSDISVESGAISPNAEWRLRQKIDMRIIPAACIIYLLCFLDRANIVRLSLFRKSVLGYL